MDRDQPANHHILFIINPIPLIMRLGKRQNCGYNKSHPCPSHHHCYQLSQRSDIEQSQRNPTALTLLLEQLTRNPYFVCPYALTI